MKTLELQPTTENLIETYKNDTIGRNKFLHRFVKLLDSLEDSCVIAVDNQWGSGKTFFIKQAKLILDSSNKYTKNDIIPEETKNEVNAIWTNFHEGKPPELQTHITAYFDAWEYDDEEDPLLSIVYEIYKTVASTYTFENKTKALSAVGKIVNSITKVDISGAIKDLLSKNLTLDEIKNSRSIREEVANFLNEVMEEKGDRLTIFIDELDRCKPSYAVKLLERIKHYFYNDRITFVLSVNSGELQNTIKQYYGQDFNSCRYLDRFFDLRVCLPKPDMKKFFNLIDFGENYHYYEEIAKTVIDEFGFELREITRYVKLIKIAGYKECWRYDSGMGINAKPIILSMIPIMIGLKMYDNNMFNDFIKGNSPEVYVRLIPITDANEIFLENLLNHNETYGDSTATITHIDYKDKLSEVYKTVFGLIHKDANYIKVGRYNIHRTLREYIYEVAGLLSNFADFDY